jgi:hypothetical protein
MAALSTSELLKYAWRVEKFASKYKAGELFELTSKQKVKLLYEDAIYKALVSKKTANIQKLVFRDSKSKTKTYKLNNFMKNEEFGGKPAGGGAGVGIEMREINSINSQMDEIRAKTGEKFVPIKVKTKTYRAVKCVKTKGVPKSDFSILDENGNEIIWLSHKEGSSARDFQQWGGMTEANIQNHPEAQKFIKQIQEMFPDGIPNATTVAKKIKDNKLQKMSIYGVDYAPGKTLGLQNVSVVLQGPVKLKKTGKAWEFTANHAHENGEDITGDFEPVMMAIYKGDRSNFGVKGARFAIQPKGSRKVTEWLK